MNLQLNKLINETEKALSLSKNRYAFFGLKEKEAKLCNESLSLLREIKLLVESNIEEPSNNNNHEVRHVQSPSCSKR